MTEEEECEKSAYTNFYRLKNKQLKEKGYAKDFAAVSKLVSESWKALSDEEKAVYVKGVSEKRRENARNKANKQAQELLNQ